MGKLISIETWKGLGNKDREGQMLFRAQPMEVIKALHDDDDDKRTRRFVISTDAVDRMGDTIAVKGWDLKHFRKGGSVLFAHRSHELPIARPMDTKVENGKLLSSAKFPERGVYPFADTVLDLIDFKALRSSSVGFRPTKWEVSEDRNDGGSFFPPVDFLKQELLEWSVVPVPANPEALVGAKSAGIDMDPYVRWCEQALDDINGPGLWVPRAAIEAARSAVASNLFTVPVQVVDGDEEDVEPEAEPTEEADEAAADVAAAEASAEDADPAADDEPAEDAPAEAAPADDLPGASDADAADQPPGTDPAPADEGPGESEEADAAEVVVRVPGLSDETVAELEAAGIRYEPREAEPAQPVDGVDDVAADLAELMDRVHASGHILSGANADRLRRAQVLIAEVLDQIDARGAGTDNEDEDEWDMDDIAQAIRDEFTGAPAAA